MAFCFEVDWFENYGVESWYEMPNYEYQSVFSYVLGNN